MEYKFICAQSFFSEETGSHYVEGLSYTVKDGNKKLDSLAQKWAKEGNVIIASQKAAPASKLSGRGTVKEK